MDHGRSWILKLDLQDEKLFTEFCSWVLKQDLQD